MPVQLLKIYIFLIKIVVFDVGTRGNELEIAERLDIAIDVAHAVTYLHMYTGTVQVFNRLMMIWRNFFFYPLPLNFFEMSKRNQWFSVYRMPLFF